MITATKLQQAILEISELIIAGEPKLTEIDSIIGDGDHGTGMKRGFTAVSELLRRNTYASVPKLFHAVGMELLKIMGGASGVLFGSFFISGSKVGFQNDQEITLAEMALVFQSGAEAILKRGKAQLGDKTLVDALVPAVTAFKTSADRGESERACFENAYNAAVQGAENTIGMKPKKGRAKNFQMDAVGYPDPGAISVTFIFTGFKNIFTSA